MIKAANPKQEKTKTFWPGIRTGFAFLLFSFGGEKKGESTLAAPRYVWNLRFWTLGFVSDFDIRISCFSLDEAA